MARHRFLRERILLRRMRRWQREVALAVMLTVAAVAFIAAAFLRGDGGVAGQLAVCDRAQAAAELSIRNPLAPGISNASQSQTALSNSER